MRRKRRKKEGGRFTLRPEVNVASLEDAGKESDHVISLLGDAERTNVGKRSLEGRVVFHSNLHLRHGLLPELGLKVLPGVVGGQHGGNVVRGLLGVAGEPQDVADQEDVAAAAKSFGVVVLLHHPRQEFRLGEEVL